MKKPTETKQIQFPMNLLITMYNKKKRKPKKLPLFHYTDSEN